MNIAAAPHIDIRPVLTTKDKKAFVDVPFNIYDASDNWSPPLRIERLEHITPGKNPYFEHAEVAMWIAYKDGEAVGRISAQICALHQKKFKDKMGQFGFVEFIDDPDVSKALLQTAEDWLKARGMTKISGPFSFSINEETGLLIDGFDTKPYMFMGHAKPYYQTHIEKYGFKKTQDMIAYDYHSDVGFPETASKLIERAKRSSGLSIRALNRKDFAGDLKIIRHIFNDAWSENWGFIPMTDAEVTMLGKNMKMLLKDYYVVIVEINGEPAAMGITLPNVNAMIDDLNGNLLPFGWLKFLMRLKLKSPESIRLPLMGILKKYQSTSLGAVLAMSVIEQVRTRHMAHGTHKAELSWILEDNMPMRRMIEMVGGKPYKTYRVYDKKIST